MSRIYWDSMIWAYWMEDTAPFAGRVDAIYQAMERRQDSLCTSVFTIGELLTGPLKRGDRQLAQKMTDSLRPPFVDILPFDSTAARLFAEFRATYRVSATDAIHLACAAQSGVDLFLTNDKALHALSIPGIDFIAGLDANVF